MLRSWEGVNPAFIDICSDIEHKELREVCFDGKIYYSAREQLFGEIEDAAKYPKMYMESMGWSVGEITPELEECIDLEITFTEEDVTEVAKELAKSADNALKSGEATSIFEALYLARYSDDVSDTMSNIVAKRLDEALSKCRRMLGLG